MNQLQRAEITVHGDVQIVGYRYAVRRTATKLKIQGCVQNMLDGTVKIIAEAPKNTIAKFIETIQLKEPPINVEHIETKYTKPPGRFKFFTIKYGDLAEEMTEGFGTGLSFINLSRAENKQGFQGLKTEIRGMREDINKNFQEMSTKYDAISRSLSEAVQAIQSESIKTRTELIRAVDYLSQLVQEFIKETRKRRLEKD